MAASCVSIKSLACTDLPQRFVEDNANAVGKIEAANGGIWHWDREAMAAVFVEEVLGQATCFRAEYEAVIFSVFPVGIPALRLGCQVKKTGIGQSRIQLLQIYMPVKSDLVPVIQAGPFQRPVIHLKTRDADDMQFGKSGGTQAGDVPGVWRYFGFEKRNMYHLLSKRRQPA